MVVYGIFVLLMIELPKAAYPDIIHKFCSDCAGALGTYENIELYFSSQKHLAWVLVITPNPQKYF